MDSTTGACCFLLMGLFRLLITVGRLMSDVTLFLKNDYLISRVEFIFSTPRYLESKIPYRVEADQKYLRQRHYQKSPTQLRTQAVPRRSQHQQTAIYYFRRLVQWQLNFGHYLCDSCLLQLLQQISYRVRSVPPLLSFFYIYCKINLILAGSCLANMFFQQQQDAQNNKHLDALNQLVIVSKQNQILKTQLISLKQQLERTIISRDKYKLKYNLLKSTPLVSSPSKQKKSNFKREPPGTITRKQQNHTVSLKTQLQKSKGVQATQAKQSSMSPFNQDQYGLNRGLNRDQDLSYLQKIYQCVDAIMQNFEIMKSLQSQQSILAAVIPKLNSIEKTVLQNIRQIKSDIIEHFDQLFEQDKFGHRQQKNHSGCSPPVKDFNRFKDYPTRQIVDIKLNNEVKDDGKLSKSKSMQTLIRETKIKHKPSNEKQKGCEQQPTKQKWEMLNEIGLRLQNWRFSNSDSELLDNSNDQEA